MSFDLWSVLGVSPLTGMAGAAGGLAVAALVAITVFRRRDRGATAPAFSLRDEE